MEFKARGRDGSAAGAAATKPIRKAVRKPVKQAKKTRVISMKRSSVSRRDDRAAFPETVVFSATAYERFEECMVNPGEPTPSIRRGAELLRKLYPRKS